MCSLRCETPDAACEAGDAPREACDARCEAIAARRGPVYARCGSIDARCKAAGARGETAEARSRAAKARGGADGARWSFGDFLFESGSKEGGPRHGVVVDRQEMIAVQGKRADIGGYYQPGDAKAMAAPRPSKTLNEIHASV